MFENATSAKPLATATDVRRNTNWTVVLCTGIPGVVECDRRSESARESVGAGRGGASHAEAGQLLSAMFLRLAHRRLQIQNPGPC